MSRSKCQRHKQQKDNTIIAGMGDRKRNIPRDVATLEKCQPIYEELDGWQESISGIRDFEKLPVGAHNYMSRLEDLLSCSISLVSVGPDRKQVISVKDFFT